MDGAFEIFANDNEQYVMFYEYWLLGPPVYALKYYEDAEARAEAELINIC